MSERVNQGHSRRPQPVSWVSWDHRFLTKSAKFDETRNRAPSTIIMLTRKMLATRRIVMTAARRGVSGEAQEGALGPAHRAHIYRHVVPGKATTPAVVDKIETVVPVVTQHAFILSPGATTMAESLVHAQEGAIGPAHREHIYRHVIPGAAQNLAQAQEFMHAFTQKSLQRLIREVAKPK